MDSSRGSEQNGREGKIDNYTDEGGGKHTKPSQQEKKNIFSNYSNFPLLGKLKFLIRFTNVGLRTY